MKKQSILAVLLATVLVCAMACTGVAFASATELNSSLSDLENALSAEEVQAQLVYNQLMECTTLKDFFDTLMAEENNAGAWALNETQLNSLYQYVQAMYASIAEPDEKETYYFNDIIETLQFIAEGSGVMLLADATFTSGTQNWEGNFALSQNTTYTFSNNSVLTLKNPITIKSGVTLTLSGYGTIARWDGETPNVNELFIVEQGGKIVIEGTSTSNPITIDGRSVIASKPLITSAGELEFENAVIQNGKNRSLDAENKPNGAGGGIAVSASGKLTMDNCVVTRNTASVNGGGIQCQGPLTITNSTISWNRAASAETGPGVVNSGRGGGINLTGASAIGTLTNVIIEDNAAMYYGGGVQVQSGASLTMNAGTIIRDNDAILHGAGGVHVTSAATLTMDGGSIQNNTAQTVGGGIHTSYGCTLNLKSGTIANNTANGRGGGVHGNTGCAITLGDGLTISGNRVNNEPTGSAADLDATGDEWRNVQKNGAHNTNGYGGGVLIDAGTCTVNGATITGNSAAVGGGGIGLIMVNVDIKDKSLDNAKVVNFTMNSGTISGNTTSGSGAGVYVMTNRVKQTFIEKYGPEGSDEYKTAIESLGEKKDLLTDKPVATVNGGTISNNSASVNGGGLYLGENTEFYINGGAIVNNNAYNGAGVYIASGTAYINGGKMNVNIASVDGGALYVDGTVNMTAGEMNNNQAAQNGGAICVAGNGNFTMSNGTINSNTATADGGAVYMAGGDFTMHHGAVDSNTAVNGGAVYMAGSNSVFKMESGTMNSNTASNDGGAIFAKGGTLEIGLEGCPGSETDDKGDIINDKEEAHQAEHSSCGVTGTDCTHPKIQGNTAADCGGAIATEGSQTTGAVIHFYCGNAINNVASYKGVGKNVFMHGGTFNYYEGTNVGIPRDPDLVIIGGTLNDMSNSEPPMISLSYYKNNTDTAGEAYKGLAEEGMDINLPEGEYFWTAENGYAFVGWTSQGSVAGTFVRDTDDYLPSGDPIQVKDTRENGEVFDGEEDNNMHLYAIWAPIQNTITYVDGMTNEITATSTYSLNKSEEQIITVPAIEKAGYAVVGWYLYQDEGRNANWGDEYEPLYVEAEKETYENLNLEEMKEDQYLSVNPAGSVYDLSIPAMTFGNITLVADFAPMYGSMKINKAGFDLSIDPNSSAIFHITGIPSNGVDSEIDMYVTVNGNEGVVIQHIPVGTYTVTEQTGWTWRYALQSVTEDMVDDTEGTQVVISGPTEMPELTFTNTRDKIYWLDGEAVSKENQFGGTTGN